MTLHIALLGTLELRAGERSITVTAPSVAALLGCLALDGSNGTALGREEVIARLWPEYPTATARRLLSHTLHRARAILGQFVDCVVVGRQTLRLVGVTVDVREFELLARSTEPHDWQTAIALYRGDVLSSVDGEWIEERRHNPRNRYLGLLERLSSALEADGDRTNDALDSALLWSRADPLNEQAHAAVMRCYATLGQRSAALRQYHYLRGLLHHHLGIEPSEETVELVARIVSTPTPASVPPPPSNTPAEPGLESQTIRMVMLARAGALLGRRLTAADRVRVRWTIDAGAEDAALRRTGTTVALRHHRIRRLLAEAAAQGAAPTDQDLADALGVARRTIETDMATLRREGIPIETRRRSHQRKPFRGGSEA